MGTCRRLVDALPTSKPRRAIPGGVFLCSLVNLSVGLPGNRPPDRPESTFLTTSRIILTSAARRRLPCRCSPARHPAARSALQMSPRPDIRRPDISRPDVAWPDIRRPDVTGPTSGGPMSPARCPAARCHRPDVRRPDVAPARHPPARHPRPDIPRPDVAPGPLDIGSFRHHHPARSARPRRAAPGADRRVLGPCFSQIFP